MSKNTFGNCNTTNPSVTRWVEEQIKICQPDQVYWCDGSEEEDQ